ncbi:4-aminobutyrate--2-oxoglutarate transaminase [Cognatazoarcus halotolerans]|uniref:4-aminobutyrate--2-oxoglutarate transaminase n=1 Tax=Cognatazoarcus halotolerans TaxID=2686016 RepID=UPI0013581354|nr:4-aminobutyrate--2-oxoglutarate transaminase [Cognatazoarcus halotolerans]MCB1900625.1 4-aminobutyrate--2-oxoglutarate transaminase [Rhodocyclaceae bacterium]MCP5309914.1 4-aminobutyrate--2-oxoglutarate transaminase [Zoogloeaceae bacterium]
MNANTLPPGMTNADYMARRGAALPRGVGQAHPLFASKALNAELWDVEGRRYIDFVAGIAVVNTGHCHPKVVAAAQAQIPHFSHTCFQVVAYDGYLRLAERLNKLAPGDAPKKTFFVSTGAEAVENAVKIARGYTGRPGVIAFTGAFHGRTLLTLGLTGKVDPYKLGVGPFPAEIYHAPYPCALHGVSVDDAMRGIETLFKNDIEAKRVAAFIVEPVQGEGGYYPAPAEFLQRLRALADKHGIVLIADEIQTGVGRTGKMFAMEHSGVVPDIITMAKGLGGGFPIAAVVGRADIMDSLSPGGLGSTYAGAPMACAAALAVLDVVESENLCERSTEIGAHMQARLRELGGRQKCIGDVRGLGAMVAVEFFHDGDHARPAADLVKAIVAEALKRGLLLLSCGIYGNVLRLMVPLTIEQNVLDEGLDILAASIEAAAG